MNAILRRLQSEPALVSGAVSALIALAVSFGLDLSMEQTAAIMGAAAFVQALVTRANVRPLVKLKSADVPHRADER